MRDPSLLRMPSMPDQSQASIGSAPLDHSSHFTSVSSTSSRAKIRSRGSSSGGGLAVVGEPKPTRSATLRQLANKAVRDKYEEEEEQRHVALAELAIKEATSGGVRGGYQLQ